MTLVWSCIAYFRRCPNSPRWWNMIYAFMTLWSLYVTIIRLRSCRAPPGYARDMGTIDSFRDLPPKVDRILDKFLRFTEKNDFAPSSRRVLSIVLLQTFIINTHLCVDHLFTPESSRITSIFLPFASTNHTGVVILHSEHNYFSYFLHI